jgi:hypothetical protein
MYIYSCRTATLNYVLNLTDGYFHLIVAIIFILLNNPKCLFSERL